MTDLSTIPTWPRIEARTRPDGTAELTINGTSYPIQTTSPQAARDEIIRRVTDTAAKIRRPVRMATTGPDGSWPIIVHPDGTIEADASRRTADTGSTSAAPPHPAAASTLPRAQEPTTTADQPPGGHPADGQLIDAQPSAAATPGPGVPAELEPPDEPRPDDEPVQQAPDSTVGPWGQAAAAARAQAGKAAPTPEYVPRRSFLTQEQTEEPATHGWRGVMTRIGLQMAPSAGERSQRTDVRAVSQHWPGPRTVAVVNGKGGASKTPSTILLSAVFARYGGAGVLAWDNNQTRGTLGWRTEQGPHEATLLDLLPETDRLLSTTAQSADLAHFVHHQTRDKFDVLRSKPMVLADQQRVEPADVDAIWRVAAKYYRLILMDSGNDEADPMWLRMIDHTDQLVVVTTTRDDHAEAGALLLEALAQRDERSGHLAEQAVAVVSQADPKASPAELRHIAHGYRSLAREVVPIPHDPAMVDGVVRYSSLSPTTQRAWLAAGAAVARGL